MFIYTIGDLIWLAFIVLFTIWAIIIGSSRSLSQWKCKHDAGVNETMACNAICRKCGKDLGFIGAWREKTKEVINSPQGEQCSRKL